MGKGSYGVVISAMDSKTNSKVAIKRIKPYAGDEWEARHTLREIRLMRHFNHENVLKLRDIMLPPRGPLDQWNDVYLALELMDTDLHYVIHSKQALTLSLIHI